MVGGDGGNVSLGGRGPLDGGRSCVGQLDSANLDIQDEKMRGKWGEWGGGMEVEDARGRW